MNILITGMHGFVGSNLVVALKELHNPVSYTHLGEPTAERFSEILKEFFMRERKYDDAGLTPKERLSLIHIYFVQKGQVGTTMRTMEAIFSGKKLISNNARPVSYTHL